MARRAKAWWAAAAIVVLAVVVMLVVVPMLVPAGALRDRLVSAVHGATGRDLAIKGGVSVSVLPRLALSAKDASLSNASWAGPQPMVTLAELDLRLKLLPLLSGQVVVDSFLLRRPVINLATDKEGHGNWEFSTGRQANAPAPPGEAKGGGGGLPPLSLGQLQISEGRLVFADGASAHRWVVEDINLDASLPGGKAPVQARGSAKWNGRPLDLSVTLASAGDLAGGKGSPVALKLDSDLLKIGYDGSAAATMRSEGNLTVAVTSVHDLMQWLAGETAAEAPPGGPFNLAAHAAFDGRRLALDQAQFSLDATRGNGEMSVATAAGHAPAVAGKLAFERLDLSPYLPSEQGGAKASPMPAGQAAGGGGTKGWSDQPIDAAGLRAVDLDLGMTAGSITLGQLTIGQSELRLTVKDGRLVADLARMALYQGEVKGRLSVDASQPQLAVASDLSFDKVQAEPLLAALVGVHAITGTASGGTALASRGNSERSLVAGLDGKGRIAVTNGAIGGIDLDAMVHNVANAFGKSAADHTDFAELSGTYTVSNGTLTNRDLSLQTPLLRLAGAGTANLVERSLDYRLTPRLAAGQPVGKLAGLSVPVMVRGPWDNLAYAPDLSAVAGQQLGDAGKLLNSLLGAPPPEGSPPSAQQTPSPQAPAKPEAAGKLPSRLPLPIPGLRR